MKPLKFLVFLLLTLSASAQNEVWIKGKLVADSLPAMNVSVMNLVTEKTTVSDSRGEFRIEAKDGDMLVFPSVNYEYKRRPIDADDIKKGEIVVKLVPKVEQLDEVVINYDISPEQLGIPAGKKKLTVAQRRLYTAKSSPTEAIINYITGRAQMLEKGVEYEKREMLMEKLSVWYNEEFYTKTLKIPAEYVDGFFYYAAQDAKLASAVKAKNKGMAKFELVRIGQEYLEVIKEVLQDYPTEEK